MSVIFIALPVALLIALSAVIAFVYAVREGQYDDLETPPRRMLFDDVAVRVDSGKSLAGKVPDLMSPDVKSHGDSRSGSELNS